MLRATIYVSVCVILSCAAATAHADFVPYKLDLLFCEGDPVHGRTLAYVGDRSALNDFGEVATTGYASGSEAFVFTTAGIVVEAGQTLDGKKLERIGGRVEMNNAGDIVFSAKAEGETYYGIYNQRGLIAGPGSVIDGRSLEFLPGLPSVNESGQVTFRARFSTAAGTSWGYFTQDRLIAEVGSVIDGKTLATFPEPPTINDAGQIVFIARWHPQYSNYSAIFTPDKVLVNRLDVIDGETIYDLDWASPVINNRGEVVFVTLNPRRIFSLNELLVDDGELIEGRVVTQIIGPVNQNDAGDIVFHAEFVNLNDFSDGEGLFSRHGLIAAVGDTIDGKTLTGLPDVIPRPRLSINNHGQVVFAGEFGEKRGIVLATPIPEPSTLMLLSVGAVALGAWLRRPRTRSPVSGRRTSRLTNAFLLMVAFAAPLLLQSGAAEALTMYWDGDGNSPPSGSFAEPANWNPDQVPGESDKACFDLDAAYAVTFDRMIKNETFEILAGAVTFTSTTAEGMYWSDFRAEIKSDLTIRAARMIVGDNFLVQGGNLKIEDGSTLLDDYGDVWDGTSAVVDGPGTLWKNSEAISVGGGGTGVLTVQNGGKVVADRAYIDNTRPHPPAKVRIRGTGSSFEIDDVVKVGIWDDGEVFVEEGGTVLSGNVYIGDQTPATGAVTIDGQESRWINTGAFRVGKKGPGSTPGSTGSLTITGGGSLETGWSLIISPNGTLDLQEGTIVAKTFYHTDGGAFEFRGGRLTMEEFHGDLINNGGTIAPGEPLGTATVKGMLTMNSGGIEIELGGPGDYDILDIEEHAAFGGTLNVRLIDGFSPTADQEFTVLKFDSRSGDFNSYVGLHLGDGLSLEPEWTDSALLLRVVPEPSTLVLLAIGAVGVLVWAWRRRKKA